MKKSHGVWVGIETRTTRKKQKMAHYLFFFRRFGVKEPRLAEEAISDKKRTLHRCTNRISKLDISHPTKHECHDMRCANPDTKKKLFYWHGAMNSSPPPPSKKTLRKSSYYN